MDFINDNPDKPWNWDSISSNPNITMKFINDNPNKPWDWKFISRNPNIRMRDILDNPNKPWNWYCISRNPNITMDFINTNPDKPWDWYEISLNEFTKDKNEFIIKRYRQHLAAILIQNVYKNAFKLEKGKIPGKVIYGPH